MLTSPNTLNSHARSVAKVLVIVFFLNLAVAAAKLIYGIISGSISMQADGMHSTIDSFGNVVALIGIFMAGRPADGTHPYGHSKFEIFASLVIGVFLAIAAYEVGSGAIERLLSNEFSVNVDAGSFVVMISTLTINIFVTSYERRAGKRYSSEILKADSLHTLSDVLTSLGVIVGLIFVINGFPIADAIMALVVTVFIAISAVSVFRSALKVLSDHSQISESEVQRIADELPGIVEVHAIRSRGTASEVYCDLHLLVVPDMTVRTAHALGDRLEEEIKERFPNVKEVLVHIEPYGVEQIADLQDKNSDKEDI